ncbi:hypothetical protein C8R45DRAFT_1150252 [Mycena sanguinolenta]|nr:hypothetical protein C8R45DRAFT_1150252 [Mycena sanguinolenta]
MSSAALPLELEREIFETAAASHPETIFNLLLVSNRVKEWIDGMQYTTVMAEPMGGACPVDVVLRAIQSGSKPPSFFHRHVRHLDLAKVQSTDVLIQALSACSGAHNLVIRKRRRRPLDWVHPTMAAMTLRRLTTDFSLERSPHMFTSVTHLYLQQHALRGSYDSSRLLVFLSHFPALTHFAMGANIPRFGAALARGIFAARQTLQAFVLVVTPLFEVLWAIGDNRFLYQCISPYKFMHDWVAQTRGGIDFWARADAFIAKKRRGEIHPAFRCRIEDEDGIPGEETASKVKEIRHLLS